ncbi:MAG: RHS repeat-associated core domain-containing protein [Cyanobacteria bacterium P01_D01_bin.115]
MSRRTTFSYDANDNLTSVTDARTHTTHYTYDQLNRQVTRIDAEGETSSLTYDAVGNVTAVTDELNRMTRFRYDQRNLQTAVIDPLAQVTTSTYDEVGNLVAVTNDLGQATQYEYDRLYRLTKITDATTEDTLMAYDEVGNLTRLEDASGNVTTFAYDELNRLDRETITVEGTALMRDYDYDATSNLTGLTDRNRRERTFGYDGLNRQSQEQWLDAQGNAFHTIDYTYFKDSQLKTAGDAFSNYAYTYDLAGRLATVDNSGTAGVPNVVLSYGYDAVNNRTSVTDTIDGVAAGREAFTYDKLNRVTRLTQSGTGVAEKRVDMTYDAASQMTGLTRYSDLTGQQSVAETTYDYDLAGRLTDLTHQQGATVIADYDFDYDRANRLKQLVTPDGTSDYTYNDRHELTSTDHSYQGDEAYNYDATGNRTDNITGDHNRLLEDGTYTYQYDNEGNRTRRVETATGEVTEYSWDHRNRLTKIETKDSSGTVTHAVAYTYDVYDRRITKSIDADGDGAGVASEENFVYDGGHIALVFDENGNQIQRYFHGPQIDQILAEETVNGDTHWALTDHQGSVRDVIDNSGTVLNHIVYDSFGQVTSETDPAFDFRFGYTGRERDEESGMLYYRARYFDPAVGTFVGEDPLGFAAGDSNLYRYVFNSPTNFTDPSGMQGLAGRVRDRVGDGINNALSNPRVYDTLNKTDQFASGFAAATTGGLTDRARAGLYGETATRNHSGGYRVAGEVAGTAASYAVGKGAGAKAARVAGRALDAVDAAGSVADAASGIKDIAEGCGDFGDYAAIAGAALGGLPGRPGRRGGNNRPQNGIVSDDFDSLNRGLGTKDDVHPEGSFDIIDWDDYPNHPDVPRPDGPFRLLEGDEYDDARDAANKANRRIHRKNPSNKGLDIHEPHPVKFGGDPTSPDNKVPLPRNEHTPFTTWWATLQRHVESGSP